MPPSVILRWPRVCQPESKPLLALISLGCRLTRLVGQHDGIHRRDLVNAIGADTGRVLAALLASVRSACGRLAAALPHEMRGDSYAMDRRVARLILAL